ncbi:MAG: hypothetical protein NW241_17450 [Bacteroidia bacterium]|nr:hypothetical protein [Bacteroidia bacterium]
MLKYLLCFLSFCSCIVPSLHAQAPAGASPLEALINRCVGAYDLTPDNRLKLAAYCELKGQITEGPELITLSFGHLGLLTFFQRNLLLRMPGQQVYHLDRFRAGTAAGATVNRVLNGMFEQIFLLGNYESAVPMRSFIDREIARFNLEPFDKLYLRYLLVRFGVFDSVRQLVTFHTSAMQAQPAARKAQGRGARPQDTHLQMRLEPGKLTGVSVATGAQFYLEAPDRRHWYVTGESYGANVTAFKSFLQKLFVLTLQIVSQSETRRLSGIERGGSTVVKEMVTRETALPGDGSLAPVPYLAVTPWEQASAQTPVLAAPQAPLYNSYNWIPMMLGMLRSRQVNIGDEDVICYFAGEEYFGRVYEQLLPQERSRADAYLRKRGLPLPGEALPAAE